MRILALEFSSPVRGVAVTGGRQDGYAHESGRQSAPFALIDEALHGAELTRDDIECLVVGLGPGSNAGVRTAIAIAQGWQLALGIRILAISSAEVVAARLRELGATNPVSIGLEVRKGELWVGRFDVVDPNRPTMVEAFRPVVASEVEQGSLVRMDLEAGPGAGSSAMLPRADFLARLAKSRTDFVRGDQLEPVMLRPVEFIKAPVPRITVD